MKKFFLIAIIIIAIIFSAGCVGEGPVGDPKSVNPGPFVPIIDYGNGVYYFDGTGSDYLNTLSYFIGSHPDLRLVSEASDNRGHGGAFDRSQTQGYIVVFEARSKGVCTCNN